MNNKFKTLIFEFTSMYNESGPVTLNSSDGLVFQHNGMTCRIEDGGNIKLNDQLVIMVEMPCFADRDVMAQKFNTDFGLTFDGYIGTFGGTDSYYIRHTAIEYNPIVLMNYLSQTFSIAEKIKVAVDNLCG